MRKDPSTPYKCKHAISTHLRTFLSFFPFPSILPLILSCFNASKQYRPGFKDTFFSSEVFLALLIDDPCRYQLKPLQQLNQKKFLGEAICKKIIKLPIRYGSFAPELLEHGWWRSMSSSIFLVFPIVFRSHHQTSLEGCWLGSIIYAFQNWFEQFILIQPHQYLSVLLVSWLDQHVYAGIIVLFIDLF